VTPDDDDVDDGSEPDPPVQPRSQHPLLSPEDRTWRHPSEVAARLRIEQSRRKAQQWQLCVRGLAAMATFAVVVVVVVAAKAVFDGGGGVGLNGPTGANVVGSAGGPVVKIEVRTTAGARTASGIIYRDEYVLTAERLLDDAESIWATSAGGEALEASVVGSDAHTDLAVLRVDGLRDGAPPVRRAPLRTGSALTVAAGAVSPRVVAAELTALEQRIRTPDGTVLYGVARIDVPPQPELTGAALLDGSGRVVGMLNAMPFEGSRRSSGSTVVLPAQTAALVADAIIETGTPDHAWLGVAIREPGADGPGSCPGVLVAAVRPASPAERAGIRPGDFVVGVSGRDTVTVGAVMAALRRLEPGDTTRVDVCSVGSTTTRRVVLTKNPTER